MKQVFMRKKAMAPAVVTAEDVPAPQCVQGSVLIANRHSLISAGTETTAVGSTKRDMVVKALRDRDIRQSVVDMLVQDGPVKTADRVKFEMTKWTPLGYSGAGVAVSVGSDIEGIRPGDMVAYAGQGHAEYIRAAKNLCVPIPAGVSSREAAFVALGSIAMQAVRRADIQVGDTVAVLGLGLVGQLVAQIATASGARVLGTDVLEPRLDVASKLGIEQGFVAKDSVVNDIMRHVDQIGVDRVMICAGTGNPIVMEQAVMMARDRGRIVVVGQVKLEVPRVPFYMKELDLVVSRSYGPGRYDPQYEEHGHDYPIGYVRWTEKRNMAEFLRLMQTGAIDVKPLITHEFGLAEANDGYDLLMNHSSDCLAVLLRYDENEGLPPKQSICVRKDEAPTPVQGKPRVAVLGCGSFARQFHLPNLKASNQLDFHTLVASSGQSAKEMGVRYGAANSDTDAHRVIEDPDVDAVMIFTRDKTHAGLAVHALEHGKHVFCEKPLATTREECDALLNAPQGTTCMTGFNRRFAPMMQEVKRVSELCHGPRIIHFRVNAGPLPKDRWIFDPVHSEGRVVGEVCHFVDLFNWLIQCPVKRIVAHGLGECETPQGLEDVTATLEYQDGSLATLIYTAQGAPSLGKERLELFCDGTAFAMDDYRTLTIRGAERIDLKHRRADKGHDLEFAHFADVVRGGAKPEITLSDGIVATQQCIAIVESARFGEPIEFEQDED